MPVKKPVLFLSLVLASCMAVSAVTAEEPLPSDRYTASSATPVGEVGIENGEMVVRPDPENMTMTEDENLCIRIKEVSSSGNDCNLQIYLENRTDISLIYIIDETVINGYTAEPVSWEAIIAPGGASDETIHFGDLAEHGAAGKINTIGFNIHVHDSSSPSAGYLLYSKCTISLDAETQTPAEHEIQDTDIVMADNRKITAIVTGFGADDARGFFANAYLENKTGRTLVFTINSCSVNGLEVNPLFSAVVPSRSRSLTNICWSTETLRENGIETVTEIEMVLCVTDKFRPSEVIYSEVSVLRP